MTPLIIPTMHLIHLCKDPTKRPHPKDPTMFSLLITTPVHNNIFRCLKKIRKLSCIIKMVLRPCFSHLGKFLCSTHFSRTFSTETYSITPNDPPNHFQEYGLYFVDLFYILFMNIIIFLDLFFFENLIFRKSGHFHL